MPPSSRFDRIGIPATEYYENISEILAPEYRNLDAEDVARLLEQSDIDAEYLESFLGTLRNLGRTVSRALPQVLPIAGGIAGGVLGGPAGAAAGQMIGGLAGTALGPTQPTGSTTAPPPTRAPQTRPSVPSPFPMRQLQTPGGSPAAAQLLQLLYRPEVLQALMAMIMGQAGAPNVRVGQTPARPSALTNLIAQLANQATAEYNEMEHTIRPYLEEEDFAGETLDDPAISVSRAAELLQKLHEADLGRPLSYYSSPALEYIPEYYEIEDQSYEESLLAEFYSDLENW